MDRVDTSIEDPGPRPGKSAGHRSPVRRAVFFGAVFLVAGLAVVWLADLYWRVGFHRGHLLLLGLFAVLTGLVTLGTMHAVFGALDALCRGRLGRRITAVVPPEDNGKLEQRYAVVMPIYNEGTGPVFGRVEAIHRSIERTGHLASFDFYILSDTTDPDIWVAEEVAWVALCRRLGSFGHVFYRRRRKNENRKAGNIADFVRTWGGHYEGMLVLDADSLMEGRDILLMARVLEKRPEVGIVQTPPQLLNGESVFTRAQQFAMSLYGPLFVRGLNFWQGGSGSYWGHNAMIRLVPFSNYCELPALPGREPFGGRILSHDFVEAALMVRAGWEAWLAHDLKGTYEEAPPTLVDHLKRDRRWCQGNLQHLWLVFAKKLPLATRVHLFMGIMAYLGSPLWFLFLLFGTWVAWDRVASGLSLVEVQGIGGKLFGWSAVEQSVWLACFVFGLLLLPRVLALAGTLFSPARRSFGGGIRLLLGAALELVMSTLLAPAVMIAHTGIVLSMVAGRAVGWGTQNRVADGTGWREAAQVHWPAVVAGSVWALVAWRVGPHFLAWFSPILLGMILSPVWSVWTSKAAIGKRLRAWQILATPEELSPPRVAVDADHAATARDAALVTDAPARRGVLAAVVDPYVNGVHVSLLEQEELDEARQRLVERWLVEGPAALDRPALMDALHDGAVMLQMHRSVWMRPADNLHIGWREAVASYREAPEVVGG